VEMMIDENAAITLLVKRPEKSHDLYVTGATFYQLGNQSHKTAVVCGLALYVQWP